MAKVCFVFPRYIIRNYGTPLGVLYLCKALKEKKHEVSFIDGTVVSFEETSERLKQLKPDFLCLSIHTVFADFAFQLAKEFKKINPKGKVIAGGPHVSILPKQTLMQKGIDFIVIGEGELTLPELLKNINEPEKVAGIAFKKKNKIIFTKSREPITNLDSISFPDRTLLPEEYPKTGSTSIITSRGCPFNCAFCQPTLRKIFGQKFRMRSIKNVVEEIKEIKKVFQEKNLELKNLCFTDDGLTYNHAWLEKLAREFLRQRVNIQWSANTRADTIPSLKLLKLLKKAGLTTFSIGVESGHPFIRNEILRKGVSQEQLIRAFDLCHEAGIQALAFLMVGSPEESEETVNATVELLDRIKPDQTQVTITSPLPETYLYDYAKKKDLLQIKKWSDFAFGDESHLELKHFTKSEIKRIQKAMQYAIYFHAKMARLGLNASYSSLFKILRNALVNISLRGLEKGRFIIKKKMVGKF